MHPLISNLEDTSTKALYDKIQDLTKKYWMTKNPYMQNQIALAIESYSSEIDQRKFITNTETELDNLIKVR